MNEKMELQKEKAALQLKDMPGSVKDQEAETQKLLEVNQRIIWILKYVLTDL